MSDNTDKKLPFESNAEDTEFFLCELRFFAKIFKAEPDDSAANALASRLTKFLETNDYNESVEEVLLVLDEFAPFSTGERFLETLVKIREKIQDFYENHSYKEEDFFKNREKLELYCDYICKLNPSVFNLSSRVIMHAETASHYYNNHYFENSETEIMKKLEQCEELFEKITDGENDDMYHLAGVTLYYTKLFCFHPQKLSYYIALKKLVNHIISLVALDDNDSFYLHYLAKYYVEFASHPIFPRKEKKKEFIEVISILEEKIPQMDDDFRKDVLKLKEIFISRYKDD